MPSEDLFEDAPEQEEGVEENELLGPFGLRARLVRMRPDTLHDAERVNLNLFPEGATSHTRFAGRKARKPVELEAVLEPASEQSGAYVRFGTLEEDPDSTLSIAEHQGAMTLTLSSPAFGLFEAVMFRSDLNLYVLRELDEDELPDCGVEQTEDEGDVSGEDLSTGEGNDTENRISKLEVRLSEIEARIATLETADGQTQPGDNDESAATVINVLVVYTTAARKALGDAAAVHARAAEAVARGNRVLENSALRDVRLNLVHTEELPRYTEKSGIDGFYVMLAELEKGTATGLTGLHALRDAHKADMVSLLVANTSLGGLANIMKAVSPNFAKAAYSVVYYGVAASTWTLIHELGHNFGCCHESACNNARKYAKGHLFEADGKKWKTIMVRKSEPGTRIPYFSNPNVKYKGVATGVANTSDNARAVRTAAPTVAKFR